MQNIFNHVKITLIDNDIVRFEYSPNDSFSDQESLFVSNKKAAEKKLSFYIKGNVSFRYLNYSFSFDKEDPLKTLKVKKDGEVVYKYHNIKNSGELPLPNKTPAVFPLMDSPRLLIPADGYVKTNSGFILQKEVKDLYLLLCDNNYKKLRRQFIQLTGNNELPRLKTLGLISSRYYKYTQKTAMDMIRDYEKHDIPLDTFIVDTDWRVMEKLQGCGYTINTELFPNMGEFYRFAHKHNLDVMMNDHPLPLTEKSTVFDEEELEYRQSNLTKLYNLGLDGWWYDRNWTCKLNSIHPNIASESLGNYIFHNVTEQFYSGFVLDPCSRERNLVMSNINDIRNGLYNGMLDSRSHRYAFQWSGDTLSDEKALRNEIVNLNKCANSMLGFYSSDIGGHEGSPEKEIYIRWMQYGAFSPIMRPHCTNGVKIFREPWNYDEDTLNVCRTYIKMRYRLLNSFYTSASKNMMNGLGVCSPLYLLYPNDKKCYKEETSFVINNSILVSPVTNTEKPRHLENDKFTKKIMLTIYPNENFEGKDTYTESVNSISDIRKFYARVKAENRKVKTFSFRFVGEFKTSDNERLALNHYEPSKVVLNGKTVYKTIYQYQTFEEVARLVKNKKYKFTLETIQHRKLKPFDLYVYKVFNDQKEKIYLPEGEWYNVFHKNVYQGKRYVKERFELNETPVFVKAGSLLALYKDVGNVSKMSLKNIIYDYYTSKKDKVRDFFYEDDGKTMEYTIGEYRKNHYTTYFKDDHYIVELTGNNKVLDDQISVREVLFKAHIRDNEIIDQVLINGQPVRFKRHDHKKNAIPFLDNEFARDSKTLTFKFKQQLKSSYKIELVLKK